VANYNDLKRTTMDRATARELEVRGKGIRAGLRPRTDGDLPDLAMSVETSGGGPSVDIEDPAAKAAPRALAGVDAKPFESPAESYDDYMKDKAKPTKKGGAMLAQGARGAGVTVLQDFLNAAGYDAGAVDGKFGKKTEAALKAFQRDNGLDSDGLVGEQTASRIRDLHAAGHANIRSLSMDGAAPGKMPEGYAGSKGEDDFVRYLLTDRVPMSASTPGGPVDTSRITPEIAAGMTPEAAKFLYEENMITKDVLDLVNQQRDGVADTSD